MKGTGDNNTQNTPVDESKADESIKKSELARQPSGTFFDQIPVGQEHVEISGKKMPNVKTKLLKETLDSVEGAERLVKNPLTEAKLAEKDANFGTYTTEEIKNRVVDTLQDILTKNPARYPQGSSITKETTNKVREAIESGIIPLLVTKNGKIDGSDGINGKIIKEFENIGKSSFQKKDYNKNEYDIPDDVIMSMVEAATKVHNGASPKINNGAGKHQENLDKLDGIRHPEKYLKTTTVLQQEAPKDVISNLIAQGKKFITKKIIPSKTNISFQDKVTKEENEAQGKGHGI